MSVVEILEEAKALIDTPEKWTKGEWTRPISDEEYCHCAEGAINECLNIDFSNLADVRNAHYFFTKAIGTQLIPEWNDAPERTYAEVMEAFDKAIELAKAEERYD